MYGSGLTEPLDVLIGGRAENVVVVVETEMTVRVNAAVNFIFLSMVRLNGMSRKKTCYGRVGWGG